MIGGLKIYDGYNLNFRKLNKSRNELLGRILYTKTLRSQYNESKEFSLFGEILYICDRNGERSLAIQNNVPQSTPLISKSLPVRITPNGNLLLLSQIARNLKNDSENLFSW